MTDILREYTINASVFIDGSSYEPGDAVTLPDSSQNLKLLLQNGILSLKTETEAPETDPA